MEYDIQLIGQRIKMARKAKRYTQDYVSARTSIGDLLQGLTPRQLQDVETILKNLCKKLQINTTDNNIHHIWCNINTSYLV